MFQKKLFSDNSIRYQSVLLMLSAHVAYKIGVKNVHLDYTLYMFKFNILRVAGAATIYTTSFHWWSQIHHPPISFSFYLKLHKNFFFLQLTTFF